MRTLKLIGIGIIALVLLTVCFVLALRWVAGAKDANIRQKIPGTWITDWNDDFSWKFEPKANGSGFSKLYLGGEPKGWSADGTWEVKDGVLVLTMTNHPYPSQLRVDTFPIIQFDDHEMKLQNGTEPPLTAHKK